MKKNILLTTFIACNLWLCYLLITTKKEYNLNLQSLAAKSIDNYKDFISDSFIKSIKYEECSFHVSIDARKKILDLFSEKSNNKLFFRISFPYCGSCIFPVIDELESIYHNTGIDNIFIITSFPNEDYAKEFEDFMKTKKLKIINIPDVDFCLDTKGFNGSYLFIMDEELHHKKLLFINKFNHFILDNYLDYIYQDY